MIEQIDLKVENGDRFEGDCVVYFVPKEEENEEPYGNVPEFNQELPREFEGERDSTAVVESGEFEADRLLLYGCGDPEDLTIQQATEIAGGVHNELDDRKIKSAAVVYPLWWNIEREASARELVTGLKLASYEFDHYQNDEDAEEDQDEEVELESMVIYLGDARSKSTVSDGISEGNKLSDAVGFSRDLANEPSNELTPARLAERAEEEFSDTGVSVEVWDEEDLIEDGMNLIRGVGQGSEQPSRLIRMDYEPDSPKGYTVLAGKGVTFDSGGISIKPSEKMDEMKFDMCGSATVLGVMKAVSLLNLPVRVTGFVPSAENMPGQNAIKPGDIISGYYDKSVEIKNTDAEGRLLLADTLGYISENLADDLDVLVDYATLTGACITALGHEAAGLMGNDDDLCEELMDAGEETDERVWQLPLMEEHTEQMDSEVADVKNLGGKAGAITAGAFLREFVDEDDIEHWAHLDVAGTGWGMKSLSYRPEGGTGFGVRLTVEFLKQHWSLS